MFKTQSPVRQRVMAKIDSFLTEAEAIHAQKENELIEKHTAQLADLHAKCEREHNELLEETVSGILSKIL